MHDHPKLFKGAMLRREVGPTSKLVNLAFIRYEKIGYRERASLDKLTATFDIGLGVAYDPIFWAGVYIRPFKFHPERRVYLSKLNLVFPSFIILENVNLALRLLYEVYILSWWIPPQGKRDPHPLLLVRKNELTFSSKPNEQEEASSSDSDFDSTRFEWIKDDDQNCPLWTWTSSSTIESIIHEAVTLASEAPQHSPFALGGSTKGNVRRFAFSQANKVFSTKETCPLPLPKGKLMDGSFLIRVDYGLVFVVFKETIKGEAEQDKQRCEKLEFELTTSKRPCKVVAQVKLFYPDLDLDKLDGLKRCAGVPQGENARSGYAHDVGVQSGDNKDVSVPVGDAHDAGV
ncbi:hypothetical protein Fmac_021322 [Flemingia macrophylla]|uniref:Uncharacterized protein n=1 Tax=Flemingia macrophylla TaxID=520843 RepID=A0ABD1LWL0_9FABA